MVLSDYENKDDDCYAEAAYCDGQESFENDYDYQVDEEIPEREMPPPLGVLSKGPVWYFCPRMEYNNMHARFPSILSYLTTEEGDELVDFMASLEQVCPVSGCQDSTPDYFRSELVGTAIGRGDIAIAEKHLALMNDRSSVEAEMQAYREHCEFVARIRSQRTTPRRGRRSSLAC